jgi:hypothetical protein
MKQRAPARCEVFDCESFQPYGTIQSVDTLSGIVLQFIGWDAAGLVAWDSTTSPVPRAAAAEVTDAVACTYSAIVAPLAAGVYTWEVRAAGGDPVYVWGFVTVTGSPPDNE